MQNIFDSGVNLSIAGRVALITGGSRGIGAATVRMFRQAGARVVFSYRSAEAQAGALVGAGGGEAGCRGVPQGVASGGEWEGPGGGAGLGFWRVGSPIL